MTTKQTGIAAQITSVIFGIIWLLVLLHVFNLTQQEIDIISTILPAAISLIIATHIFSSHNTQVAAMNAASNLGPQLAAEIIAATTGNSTGQKIKQAAESTPGQTAVAQTSQSGTPPPTTTPTPGVPPETSGSG